MKPKTRPLGSPASAPAFTDIEFFRLLVADRADADRMKGDFRTVSFVALHMQNLAELLEAELSPTQQTAFLIRIAALCERAAVDLTIPASRQTKTGRDRRSARSAPRKGSNK